MNISRQVLADSFLASNNIEVQEVIERSVVRVRQGLKISADKKAMK
jgi:hypothetical protein